MGKSKSKKNSDKKKLEIMYGIPHCHTENSTGVGSVRDALKYSKNKNIDFIIITDHNNPLKDTRKHKDSSLSKWEYSMKQINKFNKKQSNFIGILGFEFTFKPYGHFNVFASDKFFTGYIQDVKKILLWSSVNNPIIAINHPGKNVEKLPYDSTLNNYMCLIEVGNGLYPSKTYNRYEKRYYSLLDKGWMLGAINGQDNHKMNFGDSENLTAVLVHKKDKRNLLESLRKRHTYSTESKSLKVHFYINKSLMGDILYCNGEEPLNFSIYAEDEYNKIVKIQVITSKGSKIKDIDFPPQKQIKYFFSIPFNEDEKWYVIKIILNNGATALTSPIFINIK
ncbi:CehA/McbA family metallohydrolase [Clostridium amazonitimonense]|uniref:CehA/McbA family metallohydrolase n=1 Tax=Clostridium amazonitimonense TaxID=1499689 RepID=UPI00050959AC|nr:CehA/McbA family metallohydrolase [Clostridium amazonitimonense]